MRGLRFFCHLSFFEGPTMVMFKTHPKKRDIDSKSGYIRAIFSKNRMTS